MIAKQYSLIAVLYLNLDLAIRIGKWINISKVAVAADPNGSPSGIAREESSKKKCPI
jgi:hypothetical protein